MIGCEANGIKFQNDKSEAAMVLENIQNSECKFILKTSGTD